MSIFENDIVYVFIFALISICIFSTLILLLVKTYGKIHKKIKAYKPPYAEKDIQDKIHTLNKEITLFFANLPKTDLRQKDKYLFKSKLKVLEEYYFHRFKYAMEELYRSLLDTKLKLKTDDAENLRIFFQYYLQTDVNETHTALKELLDELENIQLLFQETQAKPARYDAKILHFKTG